MLNIFDANSWVRRFLEADSSGLPIRNLVTDANISNDVSVYVWDGKGGNDRRRKLFPGYKANRTPPAENIFATMNLARKAFRHSKAIQVQVAGYEGDDVIAALVGQYATTTEVAIWSTDRDLYALCATPGVTHPTVTNPKTTPELIRLYKATVGDPSDHIPGIKGFGAKTWEGCDKENLQGWYRGVRPLDHGVGDVAECFEIPMGCARWLHENQALARTMYQIVGFMPPTNAEIEAGTTVGRRDDVALNNLLRGFLQ
ncbi:hypothetical protein [Telmatospirillum sp.]|uniref:hypothetical protein n=1 Tax=Telmatospirillum sp. TaxID=2079197 RepID=UPI00283B2A18|nr:hypothetical protein [Telmatospirillum sp.]MDR3436476.1 hypothetical protein [Telmatospirillum sp.]